VCAGACIDLSSLQASIASAAGVLTVLQAVAGVCDDRRMNGWMAASLAGWPDEWCRHTSACISIMSMTMHRHDH